MEATYIRESSEHYLAVSVNELPEGDYQMPMLLQNRIPGVLPVHMQLIDGVSALYYEVTSFRSLSSSFEAEKLNLDMILKILLSMSHVAEEIDRYLLRGNGIVLDPDFVFVSMDRSEISFCYNPCGNGTIAEGLNGMARFILDHIDYEDRKCTALAYGLFQESMKESVSVTDFAKMALGYDMEKQKEEKGTLKTELTETEVQTSVCKEQEGMVKEDIRYATDWKKTILEILILGSLNAASLAVFFWAMGILRNYLRPGSTEMIMVSVTGLLVIAMLVIAAEHIMIWWYHREQRMGRRMPDVYVEDEETEYSV